VGCFILIESGFRPGRHLPPRGADKEELLFAYCCRSRMLANYSYLVDDNGVLNISVK